MNSGFPVEFYAFIGGFVLAGLLAFLGDIAWLKYRSKRELATKDDVDRCVQALRDLQELMRRPK